MLEARGRLLAAHRGGGPAALLEYPLQVGSRRPALVRRATHSHVPPAGTPHLNEVHIVPFPQADLRTAHGIVVSQDQEA